VLITKMFKFAFFSALIVISWLAISPSNEFSITTGWDKSNHFLAFFVLVALLDNAYPKQHFWKFKLLILAIFALVIECVQSQLPWRSFSFMDIIADFAGLLSYIPIRQFLSPNYISKLFA
jgi:VanZ family protein